MGKTCRSVDNLCLCRGAYESCESVLKSHVRDFVGVPMSHARDFVVCRRVM